MTSRRDFLRLLGAGVAMGSAACERPKDRIVPYVDAPEDVVPGVARAYATSMELDAAAIGLLVESHEGRPTKVAGNPGHPASLGATGVFEQAAVFDLYDPGRSASVTERGNVRAFRTCAEALARAVAKLPGGEGLFVLVATTSSPVVARGIRRLREACPRARVFFFDPLASSSQAAWDGASAALGQVLEPRFDPARAPTIAAFDADVLAAHPGNVRFARAFADRRRVRSASDAMNRLHVVEASMTVTGGSADHRTALAGRAIPGAMARLLGELARRGAGVPEAVRARLGALGADAIAAPIADDLIRRGGFVVAGRALSWRGHAVAHAINALVARDAVTYGPPNALEAGEASHHLGALTAAIDGKAVRVLAILGADPARTAPAELALARRIGDVPLSLHLGAPRSSTARLVTWFVPEAHWLESWGDARAPDGTLSFVQPLVAPLHGGRTTAELLAVLAGARAPDAHALFREEHPDLDDAALARGFAPGSAPAPVPVDVTSLDWGRVTEAAERAIADADGPGFEIALRADAKIHDGRYADNAWLQELPHPVTKLTWGNALELGPITAAERGIATGDVVSVTANGVTVTIPALVVPGQAEGAGTLALGYGQDGVGVDAYVLGRADGLPLMASLAKTGKTERLAITQRHTDQEGRDIVRTASLARYAADPRFAARDKPVRSLYFHAPDGREQWAMSIDLTACTGCSACVVACQAENNVPVVGKEGVLHGREMHWLRIDRYVEGARVAVMPMLCQHCEKAPCEYVCPVGATTHSSDGLNQMAYPRCVGTRFCSNNCPYKVRRFNWFDYHRDEGRIRALGRNPDVTVRARGVMEKCTFCVQRIREGERRARLEGRRVEDRDVTPACAEVCPTRVFTFGSITNASSPVTADRKNERSYAVLGELGTRPRVTYLARLVNPRGDAT